MPPARKKTTASRPRKTVQPAPPVPPASNQPVIGILCGREVEVLPIIQWRKTAMTAIRNGDIDTWADLCLTDDGYDVWEELDPTMGEIGEFFASFGDEMAVHDVQAPEARRPNRAQRRASGRS